jgi:hypothetical protein
MAVISATPGLGQEIPSRAVQEMKFFNRDHIPLSLSDQNHGLLTKKKQ